MYSWNQCKDCRNNCISFDEKLSGSVAGIDDLVLHEAGAYYYTADLEKCEVTERFEPCISSYSVSEWAKPEVEKAVRLGFVPTSLGTDLKRSITRAEFARLAINFLSIRDGCFNSENVENLTYTEMVQNIGLVSGTNEGKLNPEEKIIRQDAAIMLMRVYNNYAEYDKTFEKTSFSDDAQISDRAKSNVHAVNSLGIMRGIVGNLFAPLNNFTVEQAIITLLRLYDLPPLA